MNFVGVSLVGSRSKTRSGIIRLLARATNGFVTATSFGACSSSWWRTGLVGREGSDFYSTGTSRPAPFHCATQPSKGAFAGTEKLPSKTVPERCPHYYPIQDERRPRRCRE